jgi:hypothetical protein
VGKFKEAVGKRTLSMVDMCNNAKVPDILHTAAKIALCADITRAPKRNV